jgi:hypothetical protein
LVGDCIKKSYVFRRNLTKELEYIYENDVGNISRWPLTSIAVNSLGLLDLVEIAKKGLAPKAQYQVSGGIQSPAIQGASAVGCA